MAYDQDKYANANTTPFVAEHSCAWGSSRPYIVNRWLHGEGQGRDTLCDGKGCARRFATLAKAQAAADRENAKRAKK